MSGFRIEGDTGIVAEVNARKEVTVNLPTDLAEQAGYAIIMCESDPGTKTGEKYVKSPEASEDYRLRVGVDTLLFNDTVNYANQNSANYVYRTSTLAVAWGGGYMSFNSGTVTSAGSASVTTWRTFNLLGSSPLYVETSVALTGVPPSNFTFQFGTYIPSTSAPYGDTDGVGFIITSDGVHGFYNNNGVPNQTGVLLAAGVITPNKNYSYVVTISDESIEYWIDNVLYAEIAVPAGNAQPFLSGAVPWSARIYHSTTAGAAIQAKVGTIQISQADLNTGRSWAHQLCGMGQSAYQLQNGQSMTTATVSTASYANITNPTNGSLINTAALVAGLGGQFSFSAVAGSASNEGIVTSFLNPAGTTAITARVLYITGVKISCINTGAAVAGTPTSLAWSIAFGHNGTAGTLASAETAGSTPWTKAPRRIPLGIQSWVVGALVGASPTPGDLYMKFDAPIVVNPGEYVQTVAKFLLGTATSGQQIWGHATFDGYFE